MHFEDQRIHRHRVYTLIDITKTGVTSNNPEYERMRNKQRNWETVIQILSMRTQLLGVRILKTEKLDVKNFDFGEDYKGKHRIWAFEFDVEYADLYLKSDDNYGVLKNDFAQTPVITGLDETINLPLALFYTTGPGKNIYFTSASLI